MELVIEKVEFHLEHKAIGEVDAMMEYREGAIVVSLLYNGQELYQIGFAKGLLMDRTDLDIIILAANKMKEDEAHWKNATFCKLIASVDLKEICIVTKASTYKFDMNGVEFTLSAQIDQLGHIFNMKLVNAVNNDVMTLFAKADDEVEMTDNVLMYAYAMQGIAMSFKTEQASLLNLGKRTDQHKSVIMT